MHKKMKNPFKHYFYFIIIIFSTYFIVAILWQCEPYALTWCTPKNMEYV